MIPNTKEYLGHTLTLDASWRIVVTGPLFDETSEFDRMFHNLDSAYKSINSRVEAAAKQAKASLKTNIEAMGERGNSITIKAISARNGNVVLKDGSDGYLGTWVYPRSAAVIALLRKASALRKEEDEIHRVLCTVRVSSNRCRYSRRIDPREYDEAVTKLEAEFAKKTELASKL
jgi:hypothetical protein